MWKLLAISTKHLARGLSLSVNIQLNSGSENFIMKVRTLKMRRVKDIFDQNNQLRTIIDADPHKTTWELAELNVDQCCLIFTPNCKIRNA